MEGIDDDDMVAVEAVAFNVIEVTFIEPLTDVEAAVLVELSADEDIGCAITKSRRIASFEADHVQEVTSLLAEMDLILDIGLIKHTTEYCITNNARGIKVEFE